VQQPKVADDSDGAARAWLFSVHQFGSEQLTGHAYHDIAR
jgi:hypothetical protein